MIKHIKHPWTLPLFCSLLLMAACTDRTPPEPETQYVRPAKLMTIEGTRETRTLVFTARIEALQTIDLSFEVGGPLADITVREGETAIAGALVAALEPTEFQLAAKEAEVELRLARQDLLRKREVLKDNGIAKSLVEDAETNYALQSVRLRRARERLDDSRIYSPFDAYVSRRYFDSYVNVTPGAPIVRLHDLTQLQVVISAPETLVATTNADSLVSAWVEFGFAPGRRFEMIYSENRGEADSLAQTYEVSFKIDNPEDLNVLPGMTGEAHLEIRAAKDETILLPASSIVPAADGKLSVWVYNPQNQAVTRRHITTDAPTQGGVPVTEGVVPGEQIVVAGASQLQEGMRVRPLQ